MSSVPPPRAQLPFLLMRAQSAVSERINDRISRRGHPTLRPIHGLVFTRISQAGASINDIAAFIGVTKQSAAAIVDALESDGYVTRRTDPDDRRARLIELTERGRTVTRLATAAAAAEADTLADAMGDGVLAEVLDALRVLADMPSHPQT